ncbi:anti-sigma factor [Streptomyces pseudovenezuelae]|uniref:Anti-sigma K factor RskA C-terminal domain-containing protein n=1 Tax=Streptomyces pseudovenezuelae TaxID=67350 RepID=A0ABT6LEX4_9ACTN|nr:hypothetical protein [Streptomyces pseudovenezuelae]
MLREQVLRRITTVRQETPGRRDQPLTARAALRAPALSRWALAACLAAAAALGGTAVWQHQRAEGARDQARHATRAADEIAAVLAAPDARTRAAALAGGATGTVVVSHDRDRAVCVVSGVARPPGGKVHQLWFDDDGTVRSAGLMNPGRSDRAVLLRGTVEGASVMGITVEPPAAPRTPPPPPRPDDLPEPRRARQTSPVTFTVTCGADRAGASVSRCRSTVSRTPRATSTVLARRSTTTWISTCQGPSPSGRVIRTPAGATPGRDTTERSRSVNPGLRKATPETLSTTLATSAASVACAGVSYGAVMPNRLPGRRPSRWARGP